MQNDEERTPLNPTALAVGDAAKLLAKVDGTPINEELLRGDVAAGAPANANGTINLVHYAAWLVKEMASGE
ncbi:MAG: hypothetical protein AB7O62_22860 [Pirellulales bacterium]